MQREYYLLISLY